MFQCKIKPWLRKTDLSDVIVLLPSLISPAFTLLYIRTICHFRFSLCAYQGCQICGSCFWVTNTNTNGTRDSENPLVNHFSDRNIRTLWNLCQAVLPREQHISQTINFSYCLSPGCFTIDVKSCYNLCLLRPVYINIMCPYINFHSLL